LKRPTRVRDGTQMGAKTVSGNGLCRRPKYDICKHSIHAEGGGSKGLSGSTWERETGNSSDYQEASGKGKWRKLSRGSVMPSHRGCGQALMFTDRLLKRRKLHGWCAVTTRIFFLGLARGITLTKGEGRGRDESCERHGLSLVPNDKEKGSTRGSIEGKEKESLLDQYFAHPCRLRHPMALRGETREESQKKKKIKTSPTSVAQRSTMM